MSLYVLDTDILSLYHRGHSQVCQQILAHQNDEITITVISVEESLAGWFSVLRQARQPDEIANAYDQLADVVPLLAAFRILPYREPSVLRYQHFLTLRLNVGAMDLRIAAIVLEHSATVVTRNLRDFGRIPGVTAENWSA